MRLVKKLSSAHVLAVISLFVALAGTAGANGLDLITGRDVLDGSLSGRDLKNQSLGGKKLRNGSVGAAHLRRASVGSAQVQNGSLRGRDFDHERLPGLRRTTVTAPDITNYSDFDPIVSSVPERGGDFVAVTRFRVTNTGASDEYLNCAFLAGGSLFPAAGAQTSAGGTTTAFSVTVVEAGSGQQIDFGCQGGGATTYDISKIRMRVFRLG